MELVTAMTLEAILQQNLITSQEIKLFAFMREETWPIIFQRGVAIIYSKG